MQQQRTFRQSQYSSSAAATPRTKFAQIFNMKRADHAENLPSIVPIFNPEQLFQNQQFQQSAQNFHPGPFPGAANNQQNFSQPNQMPQSAAFYNPTITPNRSHQTAINRSFKTKTSLWSEFKRIYITEVLTFTMSKSTIFTLIFSFMFLGCVFFLSGFFTATNIYREQHNPSISRKHEPSETAMLQGRPEKVVNMSQGANYAVPRNYQYQGGVKVNHNGRRPSPYAEQQIASHQPYYR